MATQFARGFKPSAPVPFLLGQSRQETIRPSFAAAVTAAAAAERAHGGAGNPRQRIALFLCELGKAVGCRSEFPLSRASLASTLGISLVRVKRTLALLSLSGVISTDGSTITVLDWRKLSGAAHFDLSALNVSLDDDENVPSPDGLETQDHLLTACGEPACFV
jgi:hypothetical protein